MLFLFALTKVANAGSFLFFYYDTARVQLETDMLFYDGANLVIRDSFHFILWHVYI